MRAYKRNLLLLPAQVLGPLSGMKAARLSLKIHAIWEEPTLSLLHQSEHYIPGQHWLVQRQACDLEQADSGAQFPEPG